MSAEQSYSKPSEALAKLVEQPRLPGARISPDYSKICFLFRQGVESIRDLAGPELKLAGVRFNPQRYAPSRSSFTYDSLAIRDLESGEETKVTGVPEGKIHVPTWSSDSKVLVFVLETDDGLRLWSVDGTSGRAERLAEQRVNGVLPGGFFRWTAGGGAVLTRLVVEGDHPSLHSVPAGPSVRESSAGEKAPLRTYQDLLKDDTDADLFHHYATSQLAIVFLTGEVRTLGAPAVHYTYRASPDRRYILSRTLTRPYSFLVPCSRFAGRYDLLTWEGEHALTVNEFPAAVELPKGFDSVPIGPRDYDWRDDQPATLVWAEALDGGDMKMERSHHDRLLMWPAPFEEEPTVLMDLEMRYEGLDWGDESTALVSEWRYSDRRVRTWKFQPGDLSRDPILFDDRSFNDRYKDPGVPLKVTGPLGTRVLALGEGSLLLAGRGASPDGLVPFLDRWEETGKQRLWTSQAPYFERVMGLLDARGERILTLRESVDEPPNFVLRDLKQQTSDPLTDFPHPTPDFRDIRKELISYKRADGVDLSGTLYLPADYSGGPLPVVMWAYPLEYKDPNVAGQVTTSPYEFNRVSYWGPMPFLALGYAVFDDPKMPIVGEDEKLPNDTFREQLVSSAQAAIDALVERGVCDPERVAVGGHSYGAFMVANLLIHCDLFKTGIARSGAYNRTLTPFGFQGEERDFWESKLVYSDMSPFFHAEKLDKPLLLIHGAEDNNAGTYPMQSERLFSAIKGLGGEARLVMLPKESHAYRAKESLLHMLWEQEQWLKRYL